MLFQILTNEKLRNMWESWLNSMDFSFFQMENFAGEVAPNSQKK